MRGTLLLSSSKGWPRWCAVTILVAVLFTTSLTFQPSLDYVLPYARGPSIEDNVFRKKVDLPQIAPNSLYLHASDDQKLLLVSGYAEISFTVTLVPEAGRNYSDYQLSYTCSNSDTLQKEDVEVLPPIVEEKAINVTVTIEFQRSVGVTEFIVQFHRFDGSLYVQQKIQFLVAGVSFYRIDAKSNKKSLLPGNTHKIESYEEILVQNMYTYYIFIQYLDGSTKEEKVGAESKMKDIKTSIEGAPLIAAHSFESCTYGQATYMNNGSVQLKSECSFGFASTSTDVYFGVKLVKYRSGMIVFKFVWSSFTSGFEDFEEEYETRLAIMVNGNPPPAVVSIAPQGPFNPSGGQLIECVVINLIQVTKYVFTVVGEGAAIPDFALVGEPKHIAAGDYHVLTFKTSPGYGTDLKWRLMLMNGESATTAVFAGQEEFLFSYATQESILKNLSPSHGPVEGGISITCAGAFQEFITSRDAIVIGGYKLDESEIVSLSTSELIFRLPPKAKLLSSSYAVEIYIVFNNIRTESKIFSYESLEAVSLSLIGASFDSGRGIYQVSNCGAEETLGSLLAAVNDGAALASLQYHWKVVSLPSKKEVLSVQNSSSLAIELPRTTFKTSVIYECILIVNDVRYETQRTAETKFELTESTKYGVSLFAPNVRSISSPPTAMRIASFVTSLGSCANVSTTRRLIYEWTYNEVVTTFSYDSAVNDPTSAAPTRFGREFMIPQEKLSYGEFIITLKAMSLENPSLFGLGVFTFRVEPAPLRPVINSGESAIKASSDVDLKMTAEKSFDPDIAVMDSTRASEGLEYKWECEMSTSDGVLFTTRDACPQMYVPSTNGESFTVSRGDLVQILDQSLFLRYTLTVSKSYGGGFGRRSSPSISQVVEVTKEESQLTASHSVSLMTNTSQLVDPQNVKYYETLIITPKGAEGVEWRFRMLEPEEQSFTFLNNPDNLVIYPGYFHPGSLVAGRSSLAIRANALTPSTAYKFLILYESQNEGLTNEAEVTLQTISRPILDFPPLEVSSGTTESTFTAHAVPSYSEGEFKYYFYLTFADGTELCIDGCSGNQVVMFRIPIAGSYRIRCAMYDARGKALLAHAEQVHTITVTDARGDEVKAAAESDPIGDSINKVYYEGDHGAFGVMSLTVADLLNVQNSLGSDRLGIETIEKFHRLAQNSRPNTPLGKDYLSIAMHFSLQPLGSTLLNDPETFLRLIQVLELAIVNTPEEERFDLMEELVLTQTRLSAHAEQFKWGGTGRRRLLAEASAGYNFILVDFAEQFLPLITTVATRDESCGYYDQMTLKNFATVSVGVFCNAEQGKTLVGESSQFEWCDNVYSEGGDERRVFVMAEVKDYVHESNVGQIRSVTAHSNVLTKVAVLRFDPDDPSKLIRADEDEDIKDCFQVTQTLKPITKAFAGNEMSCGSATSFRYLNPKNFNESLDTDAYEQVNLISTFDRESSKVSSSMSRAAGTYGGIFDQCRAIQATLIGATGGYLVGISVGVIVVVFAVSLTLWLALSTAVRISNTDAAAEEEESYVNRDPFGRGEIYDDSAAPDEEPDVSAFENPATSPLASPQGGMNADVANDEF